MDEEKRPDEEVEEQPVPDIVPDRPIYNFDEEKYAGVDDSSQDDFFAGDEFDDSDTEDAPEVIGKDQTELIAEIIKECEGLQETGDAAASVSIETGEFKFQDQNYSMTRIEHTDSGAVKFSKREEFIEIMLEFRNEYEPDIASFWGALEEYGERMNEVSPESESHPVCTMIIMPRSALGYLYVQLYTPVMWSLSAAAPHTLSNQIRILFRADDVLFKVNTDMDMAAVVSAEQRRVERRARANRAAMEQERKREEERERMNAIATNSRNGRRR